MLLFPRLDDADDHPAITIDGAHHTYRSLASAAASHAATLDRLGVHCGDTVALVTQPRIETAVAIAGNALAGVVTVPINPSVGERELAHILDDAGPRVLFAADPAGFTHHVARATHAIDTSTVAGALQTIHAPEQPLLLLYTSGTSGPPKGVGLTVRNVASNLDALADAWAWSDRDTLVHALPLFHVHGLVLGLFGALRRGAALRWHSRFDPPAIAREFDHGASMLFGVPTMYHRFCEAADRDASLGRSLANARLVVSGSAPLAVREHGRFERLCNQRIVERYGLTETLINTSARHDGERSAGYVGHALPGVELELVDDARETISAHDDATLGEVRVRGPNVFRGYHRRADATAAAKDSQQWFYTGDLATMNPAGVVRIVGRRAIDLIKTGGFKVGAGEVEAALLEHPSVREAAVVGVADDDLGERIVAFVVLRDGDILDAKALSDHVASLISPHKRPREVTALDALPRNAMGKILKTALRARVPERSS